MMRRVSLAVGRWETAAGARRALARETGMSDRGLFSFRFRLRIAEAYSLKIGTQVQYFQPRALPHDSPETGSQGGDYASGPVRIARSAVEDSGDLRPCR